MYSFRNLSKKEDNLLTVRMSFEFKKYPTRKGININKVSCVNVSKKLNENPLSKEKQTQENKVVRCQYDLYVDKEDDTFKAWSNAMVAGGYAYVLVDIFNSISKEEAKNITVEDFKKIKLDEMLTMNRQTGFYEMVEKMLRKI